ncbi:Rhodanese/Cell cycle control phosphatase superfamily protein [Rhynchospora pubera]|uniref:Rhodanese/Cell cycle control phosphatase superfamily protein n=1 Tax=Rhynchospora pubera TaxID=906938 RepID=A0AAV8H4Q9_9POAL|nr:Rhodanese/Cell cycle control phosphatase superfamily protein [Rhynchospora pubera]
MLSVCPSLNPGTVNAGSKNLYPIRNLLESRCHLHEKHFFCVQNGLGTNGSSWRAHSSTRSFYSIVTEQSQAIDSSIFSPYPNESDDIVRGFSNGDFVGTKTNYNNMIREISAIPEEFEVPNDGPLDAKASISKSFEQFVESFGTKVFQTEDAITEKYDELKNFFYDTVNSVSRSVDGAKTGLVSSVDASKRQVSSAIQEKISDAGGVAIELLRKGIYSVEVSLTNAGSFVVSLYGSAKTTLPPNVRDVLDLSEEKVAQILTPVGVAFQKAYLVIEGIEKNLGLDPSDPIVQITFLLGGSAVIGGSYWLVNYSGYSGDLAPEQTMELLKDDGSAILIDVRSEDLRERDGIPDLRRGARFKYASVTFPEIDGPIKKLLRGGKEVDDALLAVVIRNLKVIKSNSKVIIMDASGSRSKSIARSLKRLGVKRPYLLQGGFQSWKKNMRVKELKPETALTVLNEEAEAILEDVKPTPTLIALYAIAFSVAGYALLEWEKTLQLIGIFGLGQTIYRRFSSYEDVEDLKQDLRLLVAPVRVSVQAISWVSGRLEPNKIGLPISPSTSAVQDRVLQAAAKHESQPTESDESAPNQGNENLVSEA